MADGTSAPVDLEEVNGSGEVDEQPDERLERLKSVVRANIDDSVGFLDSELAEFRENASDRYYGRPYGDEVEGRSQVVSRDVAETVEWIAAQLLRIFTGQRYVEFSPFGEEDVEAADQQTEFVNHVVMQEANGTILFYDWFKEALMYRFGVVHWGYEERTTPCYEKYTGLSQEQVELLVMDEGTEIVEGSTRAQQMPDGTAVDLYDVKVRRYKSDRKLRVTGIPSEQFVVDRNARMIEDATVCGHWEGKTKSDLHALGVPQSLTERMQPDEDLETEAESQARDIDNGQSVDETSSSDDVEARFRYWTLYIRHDYDEDGYAELLRVQYVGGEIVEVEHEPEIPYAMLTPMRTPYRMIGLSITDMVEDIQRIKSVLWRQGLDNLYASNRPQREVVADKVNLSDLAQTEIGANIRVKEPGMVRDLVVPNMLTDTLAMVGYIDQVREERTGTSAASQGRDADQIHDTAKGMAQMVSQAQMRIELIARLFAEGGVKRLFLGLYNCMVRNQDPARMVRLRGKFVPIDPREWRERNDAVVTVALGAGTVDAQLAKLDSLAQKQMGLLQAGVPLVTPKHLKYTLDKMIETMGFRNTGSFIGNPDNPEEVPPPPPPPKSDAVVVAEISAQIEKAKLDAKAQSDKVQQMREQAEMRLKADQMKMEEAQRAREHELKLLDAQAKSRLAERELTQEDRQFYDKLFHDATLAREKLQQDAETARQQAAADEAAMKAIGEEPKTEVSDAAEQPPG